MKIPIKRKVLLEMLRIKRGYHASSKGSGTHLLTDRYLRGAQGADTTIIDAMGNVIISVGFELDKPTRTEEGFHFDSAGVVPPTMFSCHIDTVHGEVGLQSVQVNTINGRDIVTLADKSDTRCLGADDAAGIWIMLNMIKAKVKGLYVFHNGEEVGGIGSGLLSSMNPEFFSQFKHCIAFDRKGTHSIITAQMGSVCCSTLFANTLGSMIGMGHLPDSTGVYTDSAEYTHLIPECTNLSVGYYNEHTVKESLDLTYLTQLVQALLTVDFDTLPVYRSPDVFDNEVLSSDYDYDYDNYSYLNKDYTFYEDLVLQSPYEAAELLYNLSLKV